MSHRTITAGKEDEDGLTPLQIVDHFDNGEPDRYVAKRLSPAEWRALEELAHEVNARADA